jgi:hypothetical protein
MSKCEYYSEEGCCAPERVTTEYCNDCSLTSDSKTPLCNNECYVKVNNGVQCSVSDGKGYVCSRLPNHEGKHVACGVEHELSVWED